MGELNSEINFSSNNNGQTSSTEDTNIAAFNSIANTTTDTIAATSTAPTSKNNSSATSTLDNTSSVEAGNSSSTTVTSGNNSTASTGQAATTKNKIVRSKKAPPATITITAVGDLMAHQDNLDNAFTPKTGTYDFNGFLEYVKPYLTKSDLTIGNFETVTAGPSSCYTSYPLFNTPDSILTALSGAGFDVLSTANNHCLDRGISGLTRTIKQIEKSKMANVGSSIDGKNKYITKEINGIKVSILSYSYGFNGNDARLSNAEKTKYLSTINEAQIKSDIKLVKAEGTDAIIIIIHWGAEYQREPNASQTLLSNKMLSWGADIILGSHPHVVQKSEIIKINNKNKFVIYSMGNFISGQRRSDNAKRPNAVYTEDGVIVQLQIQKDPKGGVLIKKADYIPTWVDKSYINNRPVFKIIPILSADITGSYITNLNKSFIKQSYKNTMAIMAKFK
ncbi:MAG: CapA family protein [Ruminiclostridium sp.]